VLLPLPPLMLAMVNIFIAVSKRSLNESKGRRIMQGEI